LQNEKRWKSFDLALFKVESLSFFRGRWISKVQITRREKGKKNIDKEDEKESIGYRIFHLPASHFLVTNI